MKINFYNITASIFLILFSFACQESEDSDSDNVVIDESTLDEDLNGENAFLSEFFFDFENELNYKYNFYSIDGIGSGNTVAMNV